MQECGPCVSPHLYPGPEHSSFEGFSWSLPITQAPPQAPKAPSPHGASEPGPCNERLVPVRMQAVLLHQHWLPLRWHPVQPCAPMPTCPCLGAGDLERPFNGGCWQPQWEPEEPRRYPWQRREAGDGTAGEAPPATAGKDLTTPGNQTYQHQMAPSRNGTHGQQDQGSPARRWEFS